MFGNIMKESLAGLIIITSIFSGNTNIDTAADTFMKSKLPRYTVKYCRFIESYFYISSSQEKSGICYFIIKMSL